MIELTDERLNEIEALANSARPGPWTEISAGVGYSDQLIIDITGSDGWKQMSYDDEQFILATRESVPALVAEVRRLRAELSETQSVADHWRCIAEGKDSRWLWVAAMQWLPSDLWCELNLASTQSAWFMRLCDAWNALTEKTRV